MNQFKYYFLLLTVALHLQSYAQVWESGVPQTLAIQRTQEISHVKYVLSLTIPEAKEDSISGEIEIFFTHSGNHDVAIDFEGKSQKSYPARVNGRNKTLKWENGHIIVPEKYLKKGKNSVHLTFVSADKALNRNIDFMYTLFVPGNAHTAFPCFDQPDMKAVFELSLTIPKGWEALSNAKMTKKDDEKGIIRFAESELIPTYLFSFCVGKFSAQTQTRNGRTVTAYYRETDPQKTAQLPTIFDLYFTSLDRLEEYTGIAYPFQKYDFIILPGYPFGGMEHPGAIQFNDQSMFLGNNPTPDELLSRAKLIAHEAAHIWFGDLVTMRWFDDVWTKEVFANFMASKVVDGMFPDINHKLNFLKTHYTSSLATDRTTGTHPIRQPLDNLDRAGLLYGNIIYHKAPVMMQKLEEQIGEETLQRGLQAYLKKYSFANADWNDLIAILDSVAPDAQLPSFSRVWVEEKGLPIVKTELRNGRLRVEQIDPYGRNLVWLQQYSILLTNGKNVLIHPINMQSAVVELETEADSTFVVFSPNFDGRGYGRFLAANQNQTAVYEGWHTLPETERFAMMMGLYENFLAHLLSPENAFRYLSEGFRKENNPLIASSCVDYMMEVVRRMSPEQRQTAEFFLWQSGSTHTLPSVRAKTLRTLSTAATDPSVLNQIMKIWQTQDNTALSKRNYTEMAYHLAVMMPDRWEEIISQQRSRLTGADELREFDYISRACNPDVNVQRELFESLLKKENRQVEPWAEDLLALLNSEVREPQSNAYITPALEALPEIQRTGSIFFPSYWLSALLRGHTSAEATMLVSRFIDGHQDMQEALMNKLKERAFRLLNIP